MTIGLRRGTVLLAEHDPAWEEAARLAIERLQAIFQDAAIDIQHIGSTAVKGICAKPIIDIAVGIVDFNQVLRLNDALDASGFLFRGQVHPDQLLYVRGEGELRTHHVHVMPYASQTWNNYVNLRDYLNCHEEDAQAYARLKRALAQQYALDRGAYTAKKGDMIEKILRKANLWRGECGQEAPPEPHIYA